MHSDVRVATPPAKPLLVFDGDCNFCTLWVRRWEQMTGDRVDYRPAQDPGIAAQFPEIPRKEFETAVQLIETDGTVYSGAEAVFRTVAHSPGQQWPLRCYQGTPIFANFTEWAYRLAAENRTFFSRLTRCFWGRHIEPPTYFLVRSIFLRALGVIYLVAFVSLWTQISGLIGHNGILPTDRFMTAVAQQCDQQGIAPARYYLLPTLCWINSSDGFLHFQCAAGAVLACLLIFRVAPVACLALLWLLYLSLVTVGREFLGFQWDALLLETGFLAIFFAPRQWLPRVAATPRRSDVEATPSSRLSLHSLFGVRLLWQRGVAFTFCDGGVAATSPPSRLVLWLLRFLLFKLMFSSGCVKLASGDPVWRNLTALTFHYQTQPLPTWIGWYAHQLPLWFQKLSCAGMFAIELGAPFLIFAPRRLRFLGGLSIAFLQILILLTGNYTFFNWLTLALCLLLLDDNVLMKSAFSKVQRPISHNSARRWPRAVTVPLTIVVAAIYLLQINRALGKRPVWLLPAAVAEAWLSPLRTLNGYGLFAVMTTERREIIVEGSNDGVNWLPYEFKYKPGDVNRRPAIVAPHQPRLDWQMWFAALGDYRQNPWFVNFCDRLLQGSPEVLALLDKNPFPDHPPRQVRASLYDYRFTDPAGRRIAGAWWKREFIGEYLPPISLPE
jgi:lipase maturation factor 1